MSWKKIWRSENPSLKRAPEEQPLPHAVASFKPGEGPGPPPLWAAQLPLKARECRSGWKATGRQGVEEGPRGRHEWMGWRGREAEAEDGWGGSRLPSQTPRAPQPRVPSTKLSICLWSTEPATRRAGNVSSRGRSPAQEQRRHFVAARPGPAGPHLRRPRPRAEERLRDVASRGDLLAATCHPTRGPRPPQAPATRRVQPHPDAPRHWPRPPRAPQALGGGPGVRPHVLPPPPPPPLGRGFWSRHGQGQGQGQDWPPLSGWSPPRREGWLWIGTSIFGGDQTAV